MCAAWAAWVEDRKLAVELLKAVGQDLAAGLLMEAFLAWVDHSRAWQGLRTTLASVGVQMEIQV